MNDKALRRFVEHPSRRFFVIIGTAVVGLVVTWPAVDEYKANVDRVETANEELAESRHTIAKLVAYRDQATSKHQELLTAEAMGVTDATMQAFRSELVAMIRKSGCTMRRVRMGDAMTRVWGKENDSPLADRFDNVKLKESGFKLRTQQVALSATGSMVSVKRLLREVGKLEKLIHTKSFSLQKSDEDERQVILDLELLLFCLTDEKLNRA